MSEYSTIKILINNQELPAPATYEVNYEDYDADSYRDISNAKLVRNRIRANVQKITLSYLLQDLPAIHTVLALIQDKTFSVTLYDDARGTRTTKMMYAGSKKVTYIRTSKGIKGKGLSFSLIEV